MTTTYDPTHPSYVDEADVRAELTRAFDLCHGCRRCVDRCSSFPTLFEMMDRLDAPDAGLLTPSQQDEVVDGCFQCKLCATDCPYVSERDLDVPRLMLRAEAMRHANGLASIRERTTTRVLGRTDLLGTLATGPLANRIANAAPGSFVRKLVATVTGVSPTRLLPSFARQRFSTWFDQRPTISLTDRQGRVTVFPTCLVEYQGTQIGKDLVKVYERNGIECDTTAAGCCGAPWLHAGDVAAFKKVAEKNVEILAAEIRAGTDIVVPQPTCGYVITNDYLDHAGGPDAELVAEHTYDAASYLMRVHRGDDTSLDTAFSGETVRSITYHAPCHLRAQHVGFESRDLLKLTGAEVTLVQQCAGVGGLWGYRVGNDETAVPIAKQLGDAIDRAGGDVVAGDCHLANTAIVEQTGRSAQHPLQVLARAYGIAPE